MVGRGWQIVCGIVLALAAGPASAENLDAGKSGPALFSSNCTACHRTPQGLAKDSGASGLASFLRQHYTTDPGTAGQLAAYLLSVGAGDPRRTKTSPAAAKNNERPVASRPDAPPGKRRSAEPAKDDDPLPSTRRRVRPDVATPSAVETDRPPSADGKRRKQSTARHPEPAVDERYNRPATPPDPNVRARPADPRGTTTGKRLPPPADPQRDAAPETPPSTTATTTSGPTEPPPATRPPPEPPSQPAFSAPSP